MAPQNVGALPNREMDQVPDDSVGEVAQSFVDEGYRDVTCTRRAANDWIVAAKG